MLSEKVEYSGKIWQPEMQQQIFRGLLDSFSYPGRVTECTDTNTTAWLAILISLVDGETTLADPHRLLNAELWPKLEARSSMAEKAAFIVVDGAQSPDFQPCTGTLEAPETGATILLRVNSLLPDLNGAVQLMLNGPGIEQQTAVNVYGLHSGWISARHDWVSAFPLGVDMVLCDAHRFVSIPRTTSIKTSGEA